MKHALSLLAVALTLAACGPGSNYYNDETAQRLAAPAWMARGAIDTRIFRLTTYERLRKGGDGTARIYIEGGRWGDAQDWAAGAYPGAERPQNDPTPRNPVGLHLAAKDNTDRSVIWIARPCQYDGKVGRPNCQEHYWKDKEFAPEVMEAYDDALDQLAAKHGFAGFELVGFGSGAVIAADLAARRPDVLTLRTVAGTLDDPMALAAAPVLADLPQHHFHGGQDIVAPPAAVHAFLQAQGPTPCTRRTFVPDAAHKSGWVAYWPTLLEGPVTCLAE